MRLIRAAAALLMTLCAGMAGAFTGAAPAYAGGWASTVLDPVPDRFEPGRSYTIGFWVLQHGSHPFEGDLEPVGLQLVGPGGATTTFTGIALPEPAHYVTSIVIPAAGSYALLGQQGIFQQYRVGTLVAPGAVTALPVPPPLTMRAEDLPWKEIRPPDMPVDPGRNPFDGTAAVPVVNTTAAVGTQPARTASTGMRPTTTVLAALAATAAILGLLLHRRRRSGADTRR